MKYFEVTSLFKSKKIKKVIQAQNRRDAISIAKNKIPGVLLSIKETKPPAEKQFEELKEKILKAISKNKINIKHLIAAIRQLAVMTDAGFLYMIVLKK